MAGIFGSPTEPLFKCIHSGVDAEMLQEWLVSLSAINTEEVKKTPAFQGLFKTGIYAEFLLLTCDKFRMTLEAQFLALELFDRFMMQHIEDLYTHVYDSGSKRRKIDWKAIMEKVSKQVQLRIVSCCQIASKVNSHYKVIKSSRARRFLIDNGHRYTEDGILQSELRILKTLNFCVTSPTVLTFIETLYEILVHNDPATEVKVYHGISVKVLNVIYPKFEQVYHRLYEVIVQSPSYKFKKEFMAVKADKMLLAVSVMTASVYIIHPETADQIMGHLSKITRIPSEDIVDFAAVIVQLASEAS